MAKIFNNSKGFKVIEISRREMLDNLSRYGSVGMCDMCMDAPETGYYVAVLNMWLCRECLDAFIRSSKRYDEDIPVEERNFKLYCKIFGVDADL